MANAQRARMAFQAWRDHLITAPEAMEISGVESEGDLLAVGARHDEEASDEPHEPQG